MLHPVVGKATTDFQYITRTIQPQVAVYDQSAYPLIVARVHSQDIVEYVKRLLNLSSLQVFKSKSVIRPQERAVFKNEPRQKVLPHLKTLRQALQTQSYNLLPELKRLFLSPGLAEQKSQMMMGINKLWIVAN